LVDFGDGRDVYFEEILDVDASGFVFVDGQVVVMG